MFGLLLHNQWFNELLRNNRVLTTFHFLTFSLNKIPSYIHDPNSPPAHWQLLNEFYGLDCMGMMWLLSQTLFHMERMSCMVFLGSWFLIIAAYKMRFFNRGSHGRNNRGRGNWNRGPRRTRFSIHFDADPQYLKNIFQDGFFNWIGQGVVQPRLERPPFQPQHVLGIPVPHHVSL